MTVNSFTIIGTNRYVAVGTHADQYAQAFGGPIPARDDTTPYGPIHGNSTTGGNKATVGTSPFPFHAVYLGVDGKIYKGGAEFVGGGAGAGLETLALTNQFDKLNEEYVLPNDKNSRNAFINDKELLCYLRISYTSGTTILFDHGVEGELETLDDMDATTGWTPSAQTPTVAADAVNYIEGTQSVKLTKTASGDVDAYKAFTLSVTDKNLRVSAYPDTLSNITRLYVVLWNDGSNMRVFDFPVADLTAATWNHLTCDNNDSSSYTDTGTFVRGTVTRIYLGWTTSSSQAINVSWDLVRTISDRPMLVPDYGQSLVIQDNTNQEVLTLTDEDETDNTTKGSFTMASGLSNAYTNDETTTYASTTTGTIENNQFTHKSAASGQNAKTAKQLETLELGTTLDSGTLAAFARFYHEDYKVTDFVSTTVMKVYAATDQSAYFKSGDKIFLFKKARAGYKTQSMEGSHSVNFKYLTLSADGTYSSNEITLTTDTNTIGGDETYYYVIPASVLFAYSAGAKGASTFTSPNPSEFFPIEDVTPKYFADDFNRSDGAPGNGWGVIHDYTGPPSYTLLQIRSNQLNNGATNGGSASRCMRTDMIVAGKLSGRTVMTGKFSFVWNTTISQYIYFGFGATIAGRCDTGTTSGGFIGDANAGVSIVVARAENTAFSNTCRVYAGTTSVTSFAQVCATGTEYDIKIDIKPGSVKVKIWTGAEPAAWNLETENTTYVAATGGTYFVFGAKTYGVSGNAQTYLNNIEIDERGVGGYMVKYEAEVTTLDKIETITTLARQDTTNQIPVLYETGVLIY